MARSIIKAVAKALGSGGKPDLAQGGGPNVEKLDESLVAGRAMIRAGLQPHTFSQTLQAIAELDSGIGNTYSSKKEFLDDLEHLQIANPQTDS